MADKMTIEGFIEHLLSVVQDAEPGSIRADVEFRTHPLWDSLAAISTLAMIDEVYDIQLPADEMRAAKTTRELFEAVKRKVNP